MDIGMIKGKLSDFFKKYKYAFLILLLGIGLMLLPSAKESTAETQPQLQQQEAAALSDEERLKQILMQIKGAGKVEIMLTYCAGQETIYQTDSQINGETSQRSDTVVINDTNRLETGLIRQVNPAVYKGAIVVCQGADNASVHLAIVEAVSKVTGLRSDQISVLKMK